MLAPALAAALLVATAALPRDAESASMCDQIRAKREQVSPGRGQCESLTDALLCEAHYFEDKAALSGTALGLCGFVDGGCQTVARLECVTPHLVSSTTTASGRQLTKDPALRVNCKRLDCIVEDLWGEGETAEHTSFVYGVCRTAGNEILYIAGDEMCSGVFTSGCSATLEFRPPSEAPAVGTTRMGGAQPSYKLNNATLHEFVSVALDVPTDGGRRLGLPEENNLQGASGKQPHWRRSLLSPGSDPHDVLTLRLKYSDKEPACNAACTQNGLYGGAGGVAITHGDYPTYVHGSVNGVLKFSSYDISSFKSDRTTLTVTFNTPTPTTADGCPFHEAMAAADAAVLSQHGVDATRYTHVEYFLPSQYGKCAWAGLASVGCNRPGTGPRPGACFILIKDSWPTTRMHEFGHNLVRHPTSIYI